MDALVGSTISRGLNSLRSTPFKFSNVDPKKVDDRVTWIASDTGISIPKSRAKLESILQEAKFPANPIFKESKIPRAPPISKGTIYEIKGNKARVMEAYEHRGVRLSNENANEVISTHSRISRFTLQEVCRKRKESNMSESIHILTWILNSMIARLSKGLCRFH